MKLLLRYLPVILWCGVIFWFSAQPSLGDVPDSWQNFLLKKGAHVTEYAILYFLTFFAYNKKKKHPDYLIPLLFAVFYASTDELHQHFISGRSARLYDVGLDTLGGFISWNVIKKLPSKFFYSPK